MMLLKRLRLKDGIERSAFVFKDLITLCCDDVLEVSRKIHQSMVAVFKMFDLLEQIFRVSLVLKLFASHLFEFLEQCFVFTRQNVLLVVSSLQQNLHLFLFFFPALYPLFPFHQKRLLFLHLVFHQRQRRR